MSFLTKKYPVSWRGILRFFGIGIGVYFLVFLLFSFFTYNPDDCQGFMVGNFGASGRIQCSLIYAGGLTFVPLKLILDEALGKSIDAGWDGLGLIFWFIETSIYFIIFGIIYKLSGYIYKKYNEHKK